MTASGLKRSALAAFIILCGSDVLRAQHGPGVAGIVLEIRGTVLMRVPAARTSVTLRPRRDVGRAVYIGERFRCMKGARLRLRLAGEVKVLNGLSPWFTVEQGGGEPTRYKEVMNGYVTGGGRSRGDSPVFSPADGGAAVPATFAIRWNPRPRARKLALAIADDLGRELWRQDSVEGASGRLESEGARSALSQYRETGGAGTLTLSWLGGDGGKYSVRFNLLSPEEERKLGADLALWDTEADPLMRHLGRAHVYAVNGMLPQAADEYEAALGTAPEGRDLLLRTIRAQRETGNKARADELKSRLGAPKR